MKKRNRLSILIAGAILLFAGCTEGVRARKLGGTMSIQLPCDQKLVSATFKESNLWYLTRPRLDGERADVVTFKEDSNLGLLNGTVLFAESLCSGSR